MDFGVTIIDKLVDGWIYTDCFPAYIHKGPEVEPHSSPQPARNSHLSETGTSGKAGDRRGVLLGSVAWQKGGVGKMIIKRTDHRVTHISM